MTDYRPRSVIQDLATASALTYVLSVAGAELAPANAAVGNASTADTLLEKIKAAEQPAEARPPYYIVMDTTSDLGERWLGPNGEKTGLNLELTYQANALVAQIRTSEDAESDENIQAALEAYLKLCGPPGLAPLRFSIASYADSRIKWLFLRSLSNPDLRSLSADASAILVEELNGTSAGARSAAVTALGELGDQAALRALHDRLATESNPFVIAALRAYLGKSGSNGGATS